MEQRRISPSEFFRYDLLCHEVATEKFGRKSYVNLDNAATTPPLRSVEARVQQFMTTYGSVHRGSGEKSKISTDAYEESRNAIKRFVHAPGNSYVLFSGNTTGAMSMAAHYFSFLLGSVAVSMFEHSGSWLPWVKAEGIRALGDQQVSLDSMPRINVAIQKAGNARVLRYAMNRKFGIDLEDLEKILRENHVKCVVLTAAPNLVGDMPDIKKVATITHAYGAYLVVDGCQFVPHHEVDMQELGIDFLAASGHKLYAPYGGGFLVAPKEFCDRFLPYQLGGGNLPYITEAGEFLRYENERAHDAGTPNAIGAVAIGQAVQTLQSIGLKNIYEHEHLLARMAYVAMKKNPWVELYVTEEQLGVIIPFAIKGQNPYKVADILNRRFGIGVRAGNFCVYGIVRALLGVENEAEIVAAVSQGSKEAIPGVIRISFGLCNSDEDVERFIEAIEEIAACPELA